MPVKEGFDGARIFVIRYAAVMYMEFLRKADVYKRQEAHVVSQKEWEYEIKVTGEEQANALLRQLIDAGVHLVAFDLREPSLNEIFVEKVGRQDERA